MDQELKAKWVAALRSGEYEQGSDVLYRGGKFCCLGVLHKLVTGEPPSKELWDDECRQPDAIRGCLDIPKQNDLARRNDGRNGIEKHSFAQLADYIEANL